MKLKEEYKKQEKRKKIKRTNNLTQQIYLDEIVCRIITKGTSLMKKTKFIFLCHLFLCLGLFVVHDSKAAEDPALVKDINIGSGGSDPFGGERIGSTVYFRADDGINGVELWRSDGTESGTQLVRDICPGSCNSTPQLLTEMNGILYFQAYDGVDSWGLWKSDGTEAGTQLVEDINPSGDENVGSITVVNGYLFFTATDGAHGIELWRSDGTSEGTEMVKDGNSGSGNTSFWMNAFAGSDSHLFFAADTSGGATGAELWISDGTEGGTVMVKDIYPGINGSSPDVFFVTEDGELYFRANDGVNGAELWKSDGTESGTVLVKDVYSGSIGSNPWYMTSVGGWIYFVANDGENGAELWMSDGTDIGTQMVRDINVGGSSNPEYFTAFNGSLYFSANDGSSGCELWKSDGTEAGTTMVKDIRSGSESSWPYEKNEVGGFLYFSSNDGVNGEELWKTDGTESGTSLVYDINSGSGDSVPNIIASTGGTFFMQADNGVSGNELWKVVFAVEPTVNSVAASNIGPFSAVGNGYIEDTGGENPERFIQWGTQTGIYTQNCNADTGGAGDYFCNLTGLIPDTTYYVRAYATNSAGTAYGNEITFITTSSGSFIPPAPQIKDIKEKTKNAIKLEIQVDSAYAEQELDFEIRIKNKDKDETDIKNKTEEADEEGKIILTINNFDSDTDYSISVRFSIKDQNNYSDYSDSKKIKTEKDIADDEECRIENLKAKKASQIVTLTWSKACKEINGILVERKNDNNEFKQVASLDDKDISYQDKDEKTGSEYTYRVRGYAGNKYTEYSREVSVLFDLQINQSEGDDQKQVSQTVSEADQGQYYQEQNINKEETKIINPVINTNPKRHGKEAVFFRVLAKTKEIIQEFTEEFTAVTLIGFAAGTAVAASSAAVPFLPASPEPIAQRIFAIAGMLFNRKKKGDDWGTVFDSETKQPIQGAVISLIDQTGHVVDTSISDSQGRYGFLPNPGTYTIHVFKDKHEIQTDRAEDSLYGKVYNGCTLSILQDQIENINISLKNTQVDWHDFARRKIFSFNSIFSIIKRDFFFVLFYAGALISAGIAFMFPSFFNILIFIIYLILLTYQIFFKKKAFGTITHVQTRKPISFAIVSIHEENEPHRRLKFAVSDVLGRYYLLVENGSYLVKISGNLLGGEKFERLLHAKVEDGIVNLDVGV